MNQSKMSGSSSPSQRIKRSHVEMQINNENTDPTPHICQCGEFTKYVVEIKNQMKILVEASGEQRAILTRLLRQQNEDLEVHKKFPVLSIEQLIEMDKEITSESRTAYIKAMRSVIQPAGIAKNLKYILSTKVTMAYNIDGVQGKKCLKQLVNFYAALLEAIPITGKHVGTAEEQLRKAIQLQKKREIKTKAVSKKRDNNKVPDNS